MTFEIILFLKSLEILQTVYNQSMLVHSNLRDPLTVSILFPLPLFFHRHCLILCDSGLEIDFAAFFLCNLRIVAVDQRCNQQCFLRQLSPPRDRNHRLKPNIFDYHHHTTRTTGEYFTGDNIVAEVSTTLTTDCSCCPLVVIQHRQ
ncbi:unnamed protein product [Lactuca virosa]|uniref:Uncharacterized protein n=1 Tax=Lactuca virosa TaxID=75947 RepID=A0AAU9LL00_9ASTR|nr:unnamed protein product [Lactuca virosa]